MKRIRVMDMTLRETSARPDTELSFKEKLETARQLDKLGVDVIVCPSPAESRTDGLLVRTLATVIGESELSIPTGMSEESAKEAYAAVSGARRPRLLVEIPMSVAQMEYHCHRKPAAMLSFIDSQIRFCRSLCKTVEFCAEDASRAERSFLISAVRTAVEAGASCVTLCDSAGIFLPSEICAMLEELYGAIPALKDVEVCVSMADAMQMGTANSFAAVGCGANAIRVSVGGISLPRLDSVAQVFHVRGEQMGLSCGVSMTEYLRCTKKLWFADPSAARSAAKADAPAESGTEKTVLTAESGREEVLRAVQQLGYELSEEDSAKVYEDFQRVAEKRSVTTEELEAIVATDALAVPPKYKLVDFVINSGNVITPTANIRLEKDGQILQGLSSGDGPIDAAFLALEKIIGHHYDLDDFRIQAVTEGREAMGSALVRLRSDGKLYSGKGVSTDIIGASIRAYVAALNKIVFEEQA